MICAALGICATLLGFPTVHDGDTLRLEGVSVRLYGIDAEELHEPHGPAARDALRQIVSKTTHVRCELTGDISYERRVAVCYTASGQDIGELMVRGGHALDCSNYSGFRYRQFEPMAIRNTLISKPYCRRK